ncbi:MAG: hypothetical protein ACRDOF_03830 [Gaiellaceae bacterium]
MRTLSALVALAASTVALLLPSVSTASTTDDTEVRERIACLGGTAELRLKIESGGGGDSSGSGSGGSGSSGSGGSGSGDGDGDSSGSGSGDGDGDDEPDEGELIQVELRIKVPKPVKSWRVVLLHERRLIVQGRGRSGNDGYSYRLRRTIPNWPGTETVVARMTAPNGRTCRITATI